MFTEAESFLMIFLFSPFQSFLPVLFYPSFIAVYPTFTLVFPLFYPPFPPFSASFPTLFSLISPHFPPIQPQFWSGSELMQEGLVRCLAVYFEAQVLTFSGVNSIIQVQFAHLLYFLKIQVSKFLTFLIPN